MAVSPLPGARGGGATRPPSRRAGLGCAREGLVLSAMDYAPGECHIHLQAAQLAEQRSGCCLRLVRAAVEQSFGPQVLNASPPERRRDAREKSATGVVCTSIAQYGNPGQPLVAAEKSVDCRFLHLGDGLQASRAVKMAHRWDAFTPQGPHVVLEQHKRVGSARIEYLARALLQANGGDGPIRFTPLDLVEQ